MILVKHVAGEMDECTNLQICIFCGEILCDGDRNEVFNIIRGHTPGKHLLKSRFGSVYNVEDADILGDEAVIIPCTDIGRNTNTLKQDTQKQDGNDNTKN